MAVLCAFEFVIVFTFKSSRYGLGNIWYRGITMLAVPGGAIYFFPHIRRRSMANSSTCCVGSSRHREPVGSLDLQAFTVVASLVLSSVSLYSWPAK
jgi:hypothetical protein